MIKENEIRTGNWFTHNHEWNYNESTGNFQWQDRDWFALGESTLWLENIDPIPLTEEWLLKLSFIKGKDVFFLPIPMLDMEIHAVLFHGQYVIELHNHVKAIITEVKYIHQLQNLFQSLTLQELTIK